MDRIINPIEDIAFTLIIQNNANYPVKVSGVGNPYNPLDTANAKTQYLWNISGVDIASNQNITLQYKPDGVAAFSNYYGIYQGDDAQAIVNSLNILGIGFFTTYTSGGNVFITTYNDDYVFGNLTIDGTTIVNTNFVSGTGFNNIGIYITQSSTNIYAGGRFTSYNGSAAQRLIKMNFDGTIDNTFNTSSGFDERVSAIAIDSTNNVFCGGSFLNYNGIPAVGIAKIDSTGNLDLTYVTGTGLTGGSIPGRSIVVDSSNNVYIGGNYNDYNGVAINNIVKTDSLGIIDPIFVANAGTAFDNFVNVIKFTNDGNLIIGGNFTDYAGTTNNRIVKILLNGNQDFTLNFGTGFNGEIKDIYCYTNGKFLVSGSFTLYNGNPCNNVIKLNSDATVDTSFTSLGFNNPVNGISVDETTGKIVCVGGFTTYNSISSIGVVRLNSDGSRDNNWVIGSGLSGGAGVGNSVIQLPNGNYVVVGDFTFFDNVISGFIVGLLNN